MLKISPTVRNITTKKFVVDSFKILRTHYWKLLLDNNLNYLYSRYKTPELTLVSEMDNWSLFEISGLRFFWPREFEPKGLRWLYKETFAPAKINPHSYENGRIRVNEGDWVIDAGACEGFFVRFSLMRNANVLAIEPVPRLAEALEKTYEKEIRKGKVIVLNVGIGNSNKDGHVNQNPQEIYSSTTTDENGVNVPIITLDEILRQKIIPSVNFLKMDIEGAETEAIEGAKEVLALHPNISIAVYHSYENAMTIKNLINDNEEKYKVNFRGAFIRDEFGPPRPYMLHAYFK